MRKRRNLQFKTMMCLLLSGCMVFGSFTTPTYADGTEAQVATVEESQTTEEPVAENGTEADETQVENTETVEENNETSVENTEAEEDSEEEQDAESEVAVQSSAYRPAVAANAKTTVSAVKLDKGKGKDDSDPILGNAVITGATNLDANGWKYGDSSTDQYKGCDDSTADNVIRSFDSIKYNVKATVGSTQGTGAKYLTYAITLPDDDEISLDESSAKADVKIECKKNSDVKTKTYICKYGIQADYAGGEISKEFTIYVGNKHQGNIIQPIIDAYIDDDDSAKQTVADIPVVYVTTAPFYNIVLVQSKNNNSDRDIYNISDSPEANHYYNNDENFTGKKVNGYKATYGFALEITKPGHGISGVELPDPNQDFKFDIDLSKVTLGENGENIVEKGFVPQLYFYGNNTPGGAAVADIPFTSKNNGSTNDTGCYNSGNVKMTQDGSVLHVTVNNFKIDREQFPKKNYSNKSYWTDINKIDEGVFSAFQFQVVYPYTNDKGDNLGIGTINPVTIVKNMKAVSELNNTTTTEQDPGTNTKYSIGSDNVEATSITIEATGSKNQEILYSERKQNLINAYTNGQNGTDKDIAPVGAKDVAFTVNYSQGKTGNAYAVGDVPVAIDQLVLFNNSAIENVRLSSYNNKDGIYDTSKSKYKYTVLYAKYNKGSINNENMKNDDFSMDDFTFSEKEPTGGYDGVLIQYRGINDGEPALNLRAQFFADVKNDANVAGQVYMITALTNTWTVNELKNKIETGTGKTIDDLSRTDIAEWIKEQNPTELVNGVDHELINGKKWTIDNRDAYTIPEYENNRYLGGTNHKFSRTAADALYIVPYLTTVTKTVAQLQSDNKKPYETYNISKGQRYVDYKITSTMEFAQGVQPTDGSTTTVYFTDTIPKGLSYVAGSAYWGGEYESHFPDKGTVTGGQQIEPTSNETDKNGNTILKWEIKSVAQKNGELPELHYTCQIGNESDPDNDIQITNDKKIYSNTISIQTDEDKREPKDEFRNQSTAGISIVKEKAFYIVKRGGAHFELNDSSYYELVAANTSDSTYSDVLVIDTMPSSKQDNFKGQYQITKVSMNVKAIANDTGDVEIWYTNDSEYAGKTAKDIKAGDITTEKGWKKARTELSADQTTLSITGDGLINAWPTVIVYKDKELKGNRTALIRVDYEAVAGAENDDFVNAWSTMSNGQEIISQVETDVYNRTIEGTVWFDKDKDGLIGDKEKKLAGVKVTLWVKDGDAYKPYTSYHETIDGKTYDSPAETTTDKNGHYKFSALPEGDYQVRFESTDGTNLGKYEVTKKDASEDVTKTSKVDPDTGVEKTDDGEFKLGTITNIKMPSLNEMVESKKQTYNLPDQNLGLTIPTRDITITKNWTDNVEEGNRPSEIQVKLIAKLENGKTVTDSAIPTEPLTIKPDKDDNWTGTFTNLPKYDDDLNEIQYSIEEVKVKGYLKGNVTGDMPKGFTITNAPETTSVTVTKKWEDKDNQDGKRPIEITVKLLADGNEITDSSITSSATFGANSKGEWTYTFKNLPKYKNGKEINYTVEEENVPFYTYEKTEGSASTGYIITNKYTPEKVTIPVNKVWDDNDNQDGIRPDSVTVRLYADGIKTDKTLTLSEKNKWNAEFENLDAYKSAKRITYTVQEDKEDNKDNNKDKLAGYESSVSKDDTTGTFTITNTHAPAVTSVAVTKSWNDNNNQYNNRPDKITVKLLADNKEITDKSITSELVLTKDGNWTGTFTDLPKYKAGKEIKYTVKEVPVAGYTSEITGNAETGFTITNTIETTSVSGSKKWSDANNQDGIRPDSITINLLANDVAVDHKTVTASEDGNWSWKFTDLPTYRNDVKVTYTITEDEVAGYTSDITGDAAAGYTVTNTHTPETVEVSGSKTWNDNDNQDGKRPEKITIHLFADGQEADHKDVTAADNWAWKFENLPKNNNGKEIKYTIKEDAVKDYTTAIDGYNVTNTHTPETINISGSKTWNDVNNQDGKRPESITIRLLANGAEVTNKVVNAKDNWAWNFTGLPKYNSGKEINYTIAEDAVDNYNTQINGYNVTNSYTPGKTSLEVTKVWNDANNQDGIRPKTVSVHLYKTTDSTKEPVDTGKVLTLSESNGWTGYFSELNMYEAGKTVTYSVKEDEVEGYTSAITGDAATGYTITNTHTPETINISGKKTWDDSDNQDGKRPDKITVRLLANGTEVASKEVREADNWTWTFENLAKNADGKAIVYTVTEDAVKDYTTTVTGDAATGFEVTNTYKPGKVSVSVTKAWDDNNDQDGIRPETIKIHLYADGKDTGKELTLTAKDNWSGSFTDLDECKAGNRIAYTITEDEVEGYTSAITGDAEKGYVVTNTHTPTTPEEPENPQTPQEPTTPETPQTPGTPTNPSTPVTPQNPTNPSTPDTPKTQQPHDVKKTTKTGDTTNPLPWLVLFITPFGILAERLRRRKNK